MAGSAGESFPRIVELAQQILEQVDIVQEIDQDRAILTVKGRWGKYQILLKETVSGRGRRYAYYVLLGEDVVIGLDNHADRQALRLKYGDNFTEHIGELIAHKHSGNKTVTELTSEWIAAQFLEGLERLIQENTTD